jgi:hypothetical protein
MATLKTIPLSPIGNAAILSTTATNGEPWNAEQHAIFVDAILDLRELKMPHVSEDNPTGTLDASNGYKRGFQARYLDNVRDQVNEKGPYRSGKLDAKAQNVSALLVKLGHAAIPGFKPSMSNCSTSEENGLIDILIDRMANPADNSARIAARVAKIMGGN